MRTRVCGVLISKNKILLAKHRGHGEEYWVLPGGGLEEGENKETGVIREFKEESTLDVEIINFLFSRKSNYPRDSIEYYYSVKQICKKEPCHLSDPDLDKGFIQDVKWVSYDKLKVDKMYPKKVKKYLIKNFKKLENESNKK